MTHVATINGRHWPAWRRPEGLLVDLRLFGPDGREGYDPGRLRAAGVHEDLVRAAGESKPEGFVLLA